MPKTMDPILPIVSVLGYLAIILGTSEVQARIQTQERTDRFSVPSGEFLFEP